MEPAKRPASSSAQPPAEARIQAPGSSEQSAQELPLSVPQLPQAPPISIEQPAQKPSIATSPTAKKLSPGMASLLRGVAEAQKTEQKSPNEKRAELDADPETELRRQPLLGRAWLRLSLMGADLLLLVLAARLVLRAHGRIGWFEITLCVVAVGMGAWLSCLALWRDS